MQVVSPNDMKFAGKWHLQSFDDSRFLRRLQQCEPLFGSSSCFKLPRNRCARKDSREPHPRHTWHAKQMLGPVIFGKCFANIRFDLKFQSFLQCNNKVGLINSPANRILSCKKGAVVVGRL